MRFHDLEANDFPVALSSVVDMAVHGLKESATLQSNGEDSVGHKSMWAEKYRGVCSQVSLKIPKSLLF